MENSGQAASLARKMAGKKGQTAQLQIECNNEDEWARLLTKEGLIVVDVFSEWSGPCIGMVGNLKKLRAEVGGETLHFAIAKSDEIEDLVRFRKKSEPTWMFIAGGQLVTLLLGANAAKLMKMIDAEYKHEMRVLKGETWRRGGPIIELTDEERERFEALEKLRLDAIQADIEKKARDLEEKRLRMYTQMAEGLLYETVLICFPHTTAPDIGPAMATDIDMFLRSQMMYVATQYKAFITKETFEEIFYRGGMELTEDLYEDLKSGPCIIMLLKCQIIVAPGQEGEKHLNDIETQICEALNQTTTVLENEIVVPDPQSIPGRYPYIRKTIIESEEEEEEDIVTEETTSVPGCWTPSSYLTKSAAVKHLFPSRADKVLPPEEPDIPFKVVIAFDIVKQKECFDLVEEYPNEVLNYGYFSSTTPEAAEHLCATPEQYAKIDHSELHKLIFVLNKAKSEPLLSFAGIGAVYVSPNEVDGLKEADAFFPPGVEPRFPRVEAAELALQITEAEKPTEEEKEEEENEPEESTEQNEDDLMAMLGLPVE